MLPGFGMAYRETQNVQEKTSLLIWDTFQGSRQLGNLGVVLKGAEVQPSGMDFSFADCGYCTSAEARFLTPFNDMPSRKLCSVFISFLSLERKIKCLSVFCKSKGVLGILWQLRVRCDSTRRKKHVKGSMGHLALL